VALGVVIGAFPVPGTTTLLCASAAAAFRLNPRRWPSAANTQERRHICDNIELLVEAVGRIVPPLDNAPKNIPAQLPPNDH
jgi:hypothetical protein